MHLLSGWLNIYKPKGISSASIVSKVKNLLKVKVGHAGTLDPLAEGVLPVALGEATKLTSYLVDACKIYKFKVQFGQSTSTGDSEGEVVGVSSIVPSSLEECRSIIPKFLGKITQVPSKYSAIKINGRKAYDLARRGVDFSMESREIEIFSLECLEFSNNVATYIVECSKGTYIRTLAEDISKCLQSLGFVVELVRLKVGMFKEENSIKNFLNSEFLTANLIKMEAVLDGILELVIDEQAMINVKHGKLIPVSIDNSKLAFLTCNSNLVAIGSIIDGRFKSFRVFNV